ncbi:hypothetical protein SAMN06265220_101943 [Flavobacterium nitrogenifigens]|uniref:Uncharacterized protein n=1 Tax=Flavobacterium nitrogenifigens TaxID=1617283 RepID=A0A521BER5_9FLAO|nr:hypothetical protein SAMN06265220_101943 [Flavobacterium nitrogenifigens]
MKNTLKKTSDEKCKNTYNYLLTYLFLFYKIVIAL